MPKLINSMSTLVWTFSVSLGTWSPRRGRLLELLRLGAWDFVVKSWEQIAEHAVTVHTVPVTQHAVAVHTLEYQYVLCSSSTCSSSTYCALFPINLDHRFRLESPCWQCLWVTETVCEHDAWVQHHSYKLTVLWQSANELWPITATTITTTTQSILQPVHTLVQSKLSREFSLLLPLWIPTLQCFLKVVSSCLCLPPCLYSSVVPLLRVLEGNSNARCHQSN
jgi:hypothetical protein